MRYLHTMLRVLDLDQTLRFWGDLGLSETRRRESAQGRFTLIFLRAPDGEGELELTYNWDQSEPYSVGRFFGHVAFEVDDIYATCARMAERGHVIHRPPRDGYMAFLKSPDGQSVELLQKGAARAPVEPWQSAPNVGKW
jgi:lactoylglutathione lyase